MRSEMNPRRHAPKRYPSSLHRLHIFSIQKLTSKMDMRPLRFGDDGPPVVIFRDGALLLVRDRGVQAALVGG